MIKRGGLEVKHTEDVAELIQLAQSEKADLILMDVSLANSVCRGGRGAGEQRSRGAEEQRERGLVHQPENMQLKYLLTWQYFQINFLGKVWKREKRDIDNGAKKFLHSYLLCPSALCPITVPILVIVIVALGFGQ